MEYSRQLFGNDVFGFVWNKEMKALQLLCFGLSLYDGHLWLIIGGEAFFVQFSSHPQICLVLNGENREDRHVAIAGAAAILVALGWICLVSGAWSDWRLSLAGPFLWWAAGFSLSDIVRERSEPME